jgi:sugar O-acyltransferase (sialic acid O-acetyltransferase NeuD family)
LNNIYLLGGGGHCRSCIDVIEATNSYKIAGIFDNIENQNKTVHGYQQLGNDRDIDLWITSDDSALVCIGHIKSHSRRKELFDALITLKCKVPTIVSPHSYVGRKTQIGAGTIVMHGVVINGGVTVGKNAIINSQSLLEHDVIVGDHTHVSTGAKINGGVSIGSGTFIGSGAIIHQGISIGSSCVVAAGSIVRESLEDYVWFPRRAEP